MINEYRGIARLFLMHAIGTSLAFWIYTIVRETADAIAMKNKKKETVYHGKTLDGFSNELFRSAPDIKSEFTMRQPSDVPFLSHLLHNLNFRRMFMGIFFC